MAVLRWDPWGELASLQRDMQELIGRSGAGTRAEGALLPPIDAYRTGEGMVVRIDLPGMSNDDVDVQVEEGVLTITGERHVDETVEQDNWIRRERRHGRFERSFSLPEGTDADALSAKMADGVLEITVPHPPERQPRRIEVAAASKEGAGEVVDVT
jgi:HSP20 family protein